MRRFFRMSFTQPLNLSQSLCLEQVISSSIMLFSLLFIFSQISTKADSERLSILPFFDSQDL